jgi:DNA invertase Pin-like site-specific DNA recombinase
MVVAKSESRISRNAQHIKDFYDLCEEHKVAVELAKSKMMPDYYPEEDGNAGSSLVMQLASAIAEWEAETISERTKEGLHQAERNGKWVGRSPIGYTHDKDGFLVREQPMFQKATEFIRAVNHGAPKKTAAKWYGVGHGSENAVLQNSNPELNEDGHDLYHIRYEGDEVWRRRRDQLRDIVDGNLSMMELHEMPLDNVLCTELIEDDELNAAAEDIHEHLDDYAQQAGFNAAELALSDVYELYNFNPDEVNGLGPRIRRNYGDHLRRRIAAAESRIGHELTGDDLDVVFSKAINY